MATQKPVGGVAGERKGGGRGAVVRRGGLVRRGMGGGGREG